ncbi:MAG: hypothetical protein JST00_31470 [Deltaproteobacteria bacterium]|nr:hypothetical protein [Deltaproteobacteria bacterium]
MPKTWSEAPTREQLKTRIDAFLRAVHAADFEGAFEHCPPCTFVKGEGMKVRAGLRGKELADHLAHSMFQAIDGQSAVEEELASARADAPETWCKLITPPADVDYDSLSLDFPNESGEEYDDVPDDTRASSDGEVLANVHLKGECTDITGRYLLLEEGGVWTLAFSNFDVM